MPRPWILAFLVVSVHDPSAGDFTGHPRPRVDLLPLIQPRHDVVQGNWETKDHALECMEMTRAARIALPYLPPEEYFLLIEAERIEGNDAFIVGLVSGEHQFVHILDGYTAAGKCLSGFEVLDQQQADANESMRPGRSFAEGKRSILVYTVQRGRVTVKVNGETVLSWQGDFKRLSVRPDYRIHNSGTLFVGAWMSRYRITRLSLHPLSPGGRRLRDS